MLVDTRRGFVDPTIPSIDGNHAIAAIEIPAGYTNPLLQSVVTAKSGKRYLIFDPTNEWIPIGQIPPYLQGGYGILSEGGQSQLIALPVMTPASDRIDHTIHAQLAADGSLEASVVEQRFGYAAERPRVTFTGGSQQQQRDYLEKRLAPRYQQRLDRETRRGTLHRAQPPTGARLQLPRCELRAQRRRLCCWSVRASSARTPGHCRAKRAPGPSTSAPFKVAATTSTSLCRPAMSSMSSPNAVSLDTDFASYHSAVTADATTLHYTREYTVKQLQLDASRYDDLRKFSERVAYDEATSAVSQRRSSAARKCALLTSSFLHLTQHDDSNKSRRQLHASRHLDDREPHGLWRHATGRSAGVGTAARCRCASLFCERRSRPA